MSAASKVLHVYGDRARPEPAEHIIEFPGGAISVARVTDDEYWAHITVHTGQVLEESHRESKPGVIVDSRVDYRTAQAIGKIPAAAAAQHIAVRIYTGTGPRSPQ